jgi:hypothetical protein
LLLRGEDESHAKYEEEQRDQNRQLFHFPSRVRVNDGKEKWTTRNPARDYAATPAKKRLKMFVFFVTAITWCSAS